MRLLHLSDLHLGKRLKDFSLISDQKYAIDEALNLAKDKSVEAILVSGDVYDSGVPSDEATELLDYFLESVHALSIPLFLISGNHDSADKLHFGRNLFSHDEIFISTSLGEALKPIVYKGVNFYLLPYLSLSAINASLKTNYQSYGEAFAGIIEKMNLDTSKINVLLSHQAVFPVAGDLPLGGSETALINDDGKAVAGVGSLSASLFSPFDYVALGHIHKSFHPSPNAFYPGSLLKYHRDEANDKKNFAIVDVEKGILDFDYSPVVPLRDVIKVEGLFDDILRDMEIPHSAFVFAHLLDKVTIDNPMERLRAVFPYAAWVDYKSQGSVKSIKANLEEIESTPKNVLFEEFYKKSTGGEMTDEEKKHVKDLLGGDNA